jgi:hypothetical protein
MALSFFLWYYYFNPGESLFLFKSSFRILKTSKGERDTHEKSRNY